MAKIKKLIVTKFDKSDILRNRLDDDPGWYIHDPNGDVEWVGPYPTKNEAIEARRGLEKFYRYENV